MIKLQNLTPEVYYKESRDFQFIGRLYDLVLNAVKTNSDLLYSIPLSANSDKQLIDLMAMTLGFKLKHNYNIQQLTALCNSFAIIIKNKGNIQSIIKAINALLNAEGITDIADVIISDTGSVIDLYIPEKLTDLNLLYDLLDYILPAGMICNIYRESTAKYTSATMLNAGEVSVTSYKPINKDYSAILDLKNTDDEKLKELITLEAANKKGLGINSLVWNPDEGQPSKKDGGNN